MLTYAMRRDRAEQLIELGKDVGFEPRGILARGWRCDPARRARAVARRRRATDGAVAVIDIGHERTDVVVVAARQGGVQPQHRARRQAGDRRRSRTSGGSTATRPRRAKHADGFVASTAEPATSEAWQRDPRRRRPGAHAVRARPAPDPRGVPREDRVHADRRAARRRRLAAARARLVHDRAARHAGVADDAPTTRPRCAASSSASARTTCRSMPRR